MDTDQHGRGKGQMRKVERWSAGALEKMRQTTAAWAESVEKGADGQRLTTQVSPHNPP